MAEVDTPKTESKRPLVSITEDAAQRLEAEMDEHEDVQALRLLVQEGCCGFGYAMAMARRDPDDSERHVTANGIDVYVDEATAGMIEGATVAWTEGVFGSGFTIENPNEPDDAACGCR